MPDYSVLVTIAGNLVVCGIAYGVLSTKIKIIERDVEAHSQEDKEIHREFVNKETFNAAIVQMREDIKEIKDGMKELLSMVHGRSN